MQNAPAPRSRRADAHAALEPSHLERAEHSLGAAPLYPAHHNQPQTHEDDETPALLPPPFDPNLPQENTEVDAVQMRAQFNGLKDLIDALRR